INDTQVTPAHLAGFSCQPTGQPGNTEQNTEKGDDDYDIFDVPDAKGAAYGLPAGLFKFPHYFSPYPTTFLMASKTRSGWQGLTTYSLAPAWISSLPVACCPMALHMVMTAFSSIFRISLTAVIPSISGMVISMVTRSGFNSL